MALRIGVKVTGQSELAELASTLDAVASSTNKTGDASGKTSAAVKQLSQQARNTAAELKTLSTESEKSLTKIQQIYSNIESIGAKPLFGAGSSISGSQEIKQIEQLKQAIDKESAALAKNKQQFVSFIEGTGRAAKEVERLTGVNFEYLSSEDAKKVAVQQLEAAYSKYVTSLAKLQNLESGALKTINRKTVAVNKQVKAYERLATARAALKQGGYVAAIKAERDYIEGRSSIISGSTAYVAAMNREREAFAASVKAQEKATGASKRFIASQSNIGSAVRGVSGALGKLWLTYGRLAPMLAGFAVAAGAKEVFSNTMTAGADFDYMTKYAYALSDQSIALEDLQKQLLNLNNLTHTPVELAEGIKEMSKAGYGLKESLQNIGELSKFAAIGELDLSEATRLAVTQVKAFADEGLKMDNAINIMAATALNSPMGFEDLASALSHTTELSIVAQQKFIDVNTALGLMAEGGIKGSKAGTALRTGMLKLLTPMDKVTEKLKSYGLELNNFTKAGKIKDMKSMFDELARVLNRMPTAEKVATLKDLFGLRSMKAAAAMLRNIEDGWDNYKQKLIEASGAIKLIDKMFGNLSTTTRYQLKFIAADINRAFVEAFDKETVTEMLTAVRDVVTDPSFKDGLNFLATSLFKIAGLNFEGLAGLEHFISAIRDPDGSVVTTFEAIQDWLTSKGMTYEPLISNAQAVDVYKEKLADLKEELAELGDTDSVWATISGKEDRATELEGEIKSLENRIKELQAAADKDTAFAENLRKQGVVAKTTAKEVESYLNTISDLIAAQDNFEAYVSNLEALGKQAGMSEVEKVQTELNEQFSRGRDMLDAMGVSGWEYKALLDKLQKAVYGNAAAQKKLAEARKQDLTASKQQTAAYDKLLKQITDAESKASRANLGPREQAKAKWDEWYTNMEASIKAAGLSVEQYTELLQKARNAHDVLLNAANTKIDLKAQDDAQTLALKTQERAQKYAEKHLYGVAKLQATINREMAKFKNLKAYKDLAKVDLPAANKLASEHEKILQSTVLTWINIKEAIDEARNKYIEFGRDSDSFLAGVSAGLMEIIAQHNTLGEVGYSAVTRIHDGWNDTVNAFVDAAWAGDLSNVFESIGDIWQSVLSDMLKDFLRWLTELAIQFAAQNIFSMIAPALGGLLPSSLFTPSGMLGAASSGVSLVSGASTVAGWLGIGGQTTIAPYVAGAGVPLGTVAAGGAGAVAGGAALPVSIVDFSVDAAGGTAGLMTAGAGAAELGLGAAFGIAAAPLGLMALGSLFGSREHPSWDLQGTNSGINLKPLKMSEDPVNDLYKALERTAFRAGDAASELTHLNGLMLQNSDAGKQAANNFDAAMKDAWSTLNYLALDAGDAWASLAVQIDGSVTSVDKFIDASAGYDVSLETSASMLFLAEEAAKGNADAIGQLEQMFRSLGLSASAADQATMGMVSAINHLSKQKLDLSATATLDVMVRGDAEASASVSATAETLYPSHGDRFGGGTEDTGWGPNISDTQFWQHASGGVFERPVALGAHLFGEAGPEILAPLPGGAGAFAEMAREIKILVSKVGGGSQPITIVLQNNVAGRKVEEVIIPVIDKHIDNRERAGVSGRIAYAVG